ncbi:histone-lysine N-methyltransferase SETMAR-like [Lycorma delicatula]|uniref:histone-lysine N-methyltransferase SETMAR-like n=1 Tax=Lycorma delicatula TaxID=130591 RepID=UPI003F516C59
MRAVICFLSLEGMKPAKIICRMQQQYGESCLSGSKIYEWIDRFKNGKFSLWNEQCQGRPSTSKTNENIEAVKQMILGNRRITVDDTASELNISHGSAFSIIHDFLNFRKVCARWIPHQLTRIHKQNRLKISQKLLKRYEDEEDSFLKRIVTVDETWVYHFEPESKRQSLVWKHPSPIEKKFKTQISAGTVMMTIFWNMEGSLPT